jgi:hypothetical protein
MSQLVRLTAVFGLVVVCLVLCTSAAGSHGRSGHKRKGPGVEVIGSIEFDEHHERHDYGGLDYTNHLFKKRFIDYEHSNDDDSSEEHDDYFSI